MTGFVGGMSDVSNRICMFMKCDKKKEKEGVKLNLEEDEVEDSFHVGVIFTSMNWIGICIQEPIILLLLA